MQATVLGVEKRGVGQVARNTFKSVTEHGLKIKQLCSSKRQYVLLPTAQRNIPAAQSAQHEGSGNPSIFNIY
jgi:hypothetical protein